MNNIHDRYVVIDPVSILKKELINNNENSFSGNELEDLQSALILLEKESVGSGPSKSMIINRNDKSSWEISVLGIPLNSLQQRICLKTIISYEKSRIENSLNAMIVENTLSPELNPCVLRTFLAQKIDVLKSASVSI